MPNYKVVNADQLDDDITTVADAIRERAGTSGKLEFPSGMADAVRSIPSGGVELPELGDTAAKPTDMAAGKILYDDDGNPVVGTVDTVSNILVNTDNTSVQYSGSSIFVTGIRKFRTLLDSGGTIRMDVSTDKFGNAQQSNVDEGITFTSSNGLLLTGTRKATGGSSGGLVMKSGMVTDNATIDTGLSSVVFFMLYDTAIASQGLLSTMKDVTNSVNATTYCSSYTTYMKTYSNETTELLTIDGGVVEYGGTNSKGMISGNEYRWVAFGTE